MKRQHKAGASYIMDIYLPIAEVSLDIFVLLGLGAAVGFLSGVFGVGGGFLLTPLLIFIGVPPTVAVASSANQLVGASVSGVLAHWRRGNVDFKMGYVLLVGGLAIASRQRSSQAGTASALVSDASRSAATMPS